MSNTPGDPPIPSTASSPRDQSHSVHQQMSDVPPGYVRLEFGGQFYLVPKFLVADTQLRLSSGPIDESNLATAGVCLSFFVLDFIHNAVP